MHVKDGSKLRTLTSEIGLNIACDAYRFHSFAESVRQLVFACRAAGLPIVINDMQPHPQLRSLYRQLFRGQFDSSLDEYVSRRNHFPINLIRFNPAHTEKLFASNQQYFAGKVNVAMWSWELPKIPSNWVPLFGRFDEVWVLSEFIKQIFSIASTVPIRKITLPLYIDEASLDPEVFRRRFGDETRVFLFAFESQSGFEIKNPLALVDAFSRAFTKSDKALLIIKTMPFSVNPVNAMDSVKRNLENSRRLKKAVNEASRNANIALINGHFTRAQFFSLLASSDCYVSLHRAEGYGQVLAQSMYLGKPVIATGYSGNLEFMNEKNSLLVRYDLVNVDPRDGYYRPQVEGNVWAEPDIDEASRLMRWVYEHRNGADELGKAASKSMRESSNPMMVGEEIRQNCVKLLSTH